MRHQFWQQPDRLGQSAPPVQPIPPGVRPEGEPDTAHPILAFGSQDTSSATSARRNRGESLGVHETPTGLAWSAVTDGRARSRQCQIRRSGLRRRLVLACLVLALLMTVTQPASAHRDGSWMAVWGSGQTTQDVSRTVYCGSPIVQESCSVSAQWSRRFTVSTTFGLSYRFFSAQTGFSSSASTSVGYTLGLTAPRGQCFGARHAVTLPRKWGMVYRNFHERVPPYFSWSVRHLTKPVGVAVVTSGSATSHKLRTWSAPMWRCE